MLNVSRNTTGQHALQPVIYALLMNIGDRITRRLTVLGEKPVALAKAVGLSRSAVSQWQDGSVAKIRPENLVAAADFLRCEIRWLAVGDGPEEQLPRLTGDQKAVVDIMLQMPERATHVLLRVATAMLEDAGPNNRPGDNTVTRLA